MRNNLTFSFILLLLGFGQAQNLVPFLVDGKQGYSELAGRIFIEPQFDEALFFDKDEVANVRVGEFWSLVNKAGKVLFPFDSKEPIRLGNVYQVDTFYLSHYGKGNDTISYLRWQYLDYKRIRLLNLATWKATPILERSMEPFKHSGFLPSMTPTFRKGVFVHRLSDSSYLAVNTSLEPIWKSANPIRFANRIFLFSSYRDTTVFYNSISQTFDTLPYSGYITREKGRYVKTFTESQVESLGDGKHFIVTNYSKVADTIPGKYKDIWKAYLVDNQNVVKLDQDYESIWGYNGRSLIAKSKGFSFFIDIKGARQDSVQYISIYELTKKYYKAQLKNDRWVILDLFGKRMKNQEYDELDGGGDERIHYWLGDTRGFFENNLIQERSWQGKDMYPADLDGFYYIARHDKRGLYKENVGEIIPAVYDHCFIRDMKYVEVKTGSKLGLFKLDGTQLFQPVYDEIRIESEDNRHYFVLERSKLYSWYNESLQLLGDSMKYVPENENFRIIPKEEGDTVHFYNEFGNEIGFPVDSYDEIYVEKDNVQLALLEKNNLKYVMRSDGSFLTNEHIQLRDEYKYFENNQGLFWVHVDGREGVIHHTGKWIIPPGMFKIMAVTDHLIVIKEKDGVHLYDLNGSPLHEPLYDEIHLYASSSERWWVMKKEGKYGVIESRTGKVVFPAKFDDANFWYDQYLMLEKGKKEGRITTTVLDTFGKKIFEVQYDELYPLSPHDSLSWFETSKLNCNGIIDGKGRDRIPPVHDNISGFADTSFFRTWTKGGPYKILNRLGDVAVESFDAPTYDVYGSIPGYRYLITMKDYAIIMDEWGNILMKIDSIDIEKATDEYSGHIFLRVKKDNMTYLIDPVSLITFKSPN